MKQIKKKSGFTLIEILVTIAILSIISIGLLKNSYSTTQKRANVRESITQIQNLFNNARSMAINSTSVTENGGSIPIIPQYGYGVHIELRRDILDTSIKGSTYTLFADTNNNGDGTYGDGIFDPSADTIIQEPLTIFDSGIYALTEVIATFEGIDPSDGSSLSNRATHKDTGGITESTVLFAPLTANPLLIFNNEDDNLDLDGDISTSPYTDFTLHIMTPNIIEEKLTLNTTGIFFTRTQLSLDPTPTP